MRPERATPPDDRASREREQLATLLAFMLVCLFGGSFVLFLIFVSLGLFLWVLIIAGVIAVFTGLHYLAWGRTSREAEVEQAEDRDEPPISQEWPKELLDRRNRPSGPH